MSRTAPVEAVARASVCAAGRAGEVVEAQAEGHGAPDAVRGPHAARHAVDEGHERGVDLRGAVRAAARSRAGRPSSRGACRRRPAAGPGCGRGRGAGARRRARASRPARPRTAAATSATVHRPRACSRSAVFAPTPHSRSTGSGCRKSSSPSGGTTSRPSGLATPLATLARNFVRAMPTVIGRPTCSCTARRSRTAICSGVPAMPLHAADVEERLVDRQPLDERRRVLEDRGRRRGWPRCTPPCAAARRSRAGTAAAPAGRPSPSSRRRPWPRSSRRARPRRRR